jgi:hypothetical protein
MSNSSDSSNEEFKSDNGDPNYFGPQHSIDLSDQDPEIQPPLPGLRRAVGYPKRDWRKWRDARGQKVDAAPYRGRMSTWGGKLIPLPVDRAGHPLKMTEFQIMLRADGTYIVCDWSKPLGESCIYVAKTLKDAAQVLFMFVKWKHWQGPLRKGQSRHKAIFGVEQRPRAPAPPPSPRMFETDPTFDETEDTIDPLVRRLMWG